ncbi:MAG: hypothetical protein P8X96_10990 [Desulfobacteraceae bacterium]
MENSFIQAIASIPFVYILPLIILVLITMYLARKVFHRTMATCGRIIYNAMRLSSSSVKLAEKRLLMRNREVLMSSGLEMAERKVEREFDRISAVVQRDLEGYPQIQRKINEDLLQLEEDYHNCGEIPQTLPDWVKVIDAIANIKPTGDRMVVNMLEEIHRTLEEQHKSAVDEHRRNVSKRHSLLSRMTPIWRSMEKTLGGVQKTVAHLNQRTKKIDRYMDNYEKIRNRDDIAERQLSSSSLTQFFISGLVLAVAVIGAIINFNLVALPMSEMVGGASYIGIFKTSDVAGMFIVCLEIVVGVFLMDALRITRLFSIIGSMEDRKRKMIFWILLGMLTILAMVESSLAFMRDQIAADMELLRQSLAGVEPTDAATSSIPTIGQMIMGFILPFILTFVAIPFESFVASSRTVIGVLATWALRVLAFVLRLLGNIGFYLTRMVINLYDLIIFPALWLENVVVRALSKEKEGKGRPSGKDEKVTKAERKATLMEGTAQCEEVTE